MKVLCKGGFRLESIRFCDKPRPQLTGRVVDKLRSIVNSVYSIVDCREIVGQVVNCKFISQSINNFCDFAHMLLLILLDDTHFLAYYSIWAKLILWPTWCSTL